MNQTDNSGRVAALFDVALTFEGNFAALSDSAPSHGQQQTNEAFTEKWSRYEDTDEKAAFYGFQRDWYLRLYGFGDTPSLRAHLEGCEVIFDAGCGLGYKAAWLAELAPHALVIGMDFSGVALAAAKNYAHVPNLFFLRGDIAHSGFRDGVVDYVNCDQVIMHTDDHDATFAELSRICRPDGGEVACYFYAKKALPRELLDDHFRAACTNLPHEALWEMSAQLTELGRRLSALDVTFDAPDIPLLGIKGGTYDLQRFIYWNFIKCFWNPELGHDTSVATNFDWYSPSKARRFSEDEVHELVAKHGLGETFFHVEEACFAGRFGRP